VKTLPADGAPVKAGAPLVIDVVMRNERVGHRFPGGVVDAQDTWVELEVRDATGKRIAEAGMQEEASGEDRSAHRLMALQADEHGVPVLMRETDRFRTAVYNHTLAPRDADVVHYRLDVPPGLRASQMPLEIVARLRHRSRNLSLARAVCDDAKTARGASFAGQTKERTGEPFDPCAGEPVTEVATSTVWIGAGEGPPPAHPSALPGWRRLYDHGLGLLHALQEEVDGARGSLERALDLVPPGADRERAMILQALAEVAIREGRTEDALATLDEAERLAPEHPAIARSRGEALAGVWRWKDAEGPWRDAAETSPLDDAMWSRLAIAYGSAGDASDALWAAKHGLGLNPRDADMLRVQALALERLGAPPAEIEQAREAFARWVPPDEAPGIKSACARAFPWCALERLPVHVHELRVVTSDRASTRARGQ
jgi:hypothetical protein